MFDTRRMDLQDLQIFPMVIRLKERRLGFHEPNGAYIILRCEMQNIYRLEHYKIVPAWSTIQGLSTILMCNFAVSDLFPPLICDPFVFYFSIFHILVQNQKLDIHCPIVVIKGERRVMLQAAVKVYFWIRLFRLP